MTDLAFCRYHLRGIPRSHLSGTKKTLYLVMSPERPDVISALGWGHGIGALFRVCTRFR